MVLSLVVFSNLQVLFNFHLVPVGIDEKIVATIIALGCLVWRKLGKQPKVG
jgi:predicted methyltransferase MtxX (methanogen marker protein 4)